jgi:hypothetical protein
MPGKAALALVFSFFLFFFFFFLFEEVGAEQLLWMPGRQSSFNLFYWYSLAK